MSELFSIQQPNRNRIFKLILERGGDTRQNIARQLDLSLPTVNQYLEQLLSVNLLCDSGTVASKAVGRKAKVIAINPTARISLGMDITKHHFSLVAIDLCGHVVDLFNEEYLFENTADTYAHLGEKIHMFISNNHWNREQLLGLGISLPALVSKEGKSHAPSKILSNVPFNFYTGIEPYIDFPFRLYNDANAGGFSEIYSHCCNNRMIYLSLSHTVGSALIENNLIVEGDNNRCGELGHVTLVPNGVRCHCGQKGCTNGYCSPDVLAQYADNDLDQFFQKLEAGDAICVHAFDVYLSYLAVLMHNIRTLLDCDIVIGGAMGQYMQKYLERLCKLVGELDSFDDRLVDYIRTGYYTQNASAIGAALFSIVEFINNI